MLQRLTKGLILLLLGASTLSNAQILYSGEAHTYTRYFSSKGSWPDTDELNFYFNDDTTRIDPAALPAPNFTFSISCKQIYLLPDTFEISSSKFLGPLMQDSQYFATNRAHYLEVEKVDKDSLICLFRSGSYSQTLEPRDGGGHEMVQRWSLSIGRYVMHADLTSVRSPQQQKLVLYPNPANDVLTIRGLRDEQADIIICALQGSAVCSASVQSVDGTYTIDISMLTPGIYMAVLSGQDGIHALKFSKH